jgi:lipid-A-disaccharide synthase-like uncharacterized protein
MQLRPASAPVGIDLHGKLKDAQIVEGPGGPMVVVETREGSTQLSATEYVRAIRAAQLDQRSHGVLYVLFNISSPWGILWVCVGFAGQALFTMRMVMQWIASEREKRSVIPIGFWWGSLFGGMLLLVYFIWRKDIVGIVGQSTGVFVYARNLALIYGAARHAAVHGSNRSSGVGATSGSA